MLVRGWGCEENAKGFNYCVSLYVAIDDLARGGIHGDGTGAVDGAIGDNGLAVDAWERRWSLVCGNYFLSRHIARSGYCR